MKDVILLGIGFVSGALVTVAFGAKIKGFFFGILDNIVKKIEGK